MSGFNFLSRMASFGTVNGDDAASSCDFDDIPTIDQNLIKAEVNKAIQAKFSSIERNIELINYKFQALEDHLAHISGSLSPDNSSKTLSTVAGLRDAIRNISNTTNILNEDLPKTNGAIQSLEPEKPILSLKNPSFTPISNITVKPIKSKPAQKKVYVAYKINCVSSISEITCTFHVDMKAFFSWCDEALIGGKKGSKINYKETKGLFDPRIIVTNEHGLEEISNVTKLVDPVTGEVKRTITYQGTVFLLSMNLKCFPFDCQNLQICFKPYKLDKESVVLVPKSPDECAFANPVIHEWEVLGHCIRTFDTDPLASSSYKVYSTLFVTILVKHRPGWFISNVFLPTAAFLFVSFLTFTYTEKSERNEVSMATMMASIANKYVVGSQIPKVDYRTILDTFVEFCFYLQIFTMVTTVIVCDYRHLPIIGPYLNLLFFLLELFVTIAFAEWMYVRLRNHDIDIHEWVEASQMDFDHQKLPEQNDSIHANETNSRNQQQKSSSKTLSFLKKFWDKSHHIFHDGNHMIDHHDDFTSFGVKHLSSNFIPSSKLKSSQNLNEAKQTLRLMTRNYHGGVVGSIEDNELNNAAARVIQIFWLSKKEEGLHKKRITDEFASNVLNVLNFIRSSSDRYSNRPQSPTFFRTLESVNSLHNSHVTLKDSLFQTSKEHASISSVLQALYDDDDRSQAGDLEPFR